VEYTARARQEIRALQQREAARVILPKGSSYSVAQIKDHLLCDSEIVSNAVNFDGTTEITEEQALALLEAGWQMESGVEVAFLCGAIPLHDLKIVIGRFDLHKASDILSFEEYHILTERSDFRAPQKIVTFEGNIFKCPLSRAVHIDCSAVKSAWCHYYCTTASYQRWMDSDNRLEYQAKRLANYRGYTYHQGVMYNDQGQSIVVRESWDWDRQVVKALGE